MTIRDDLLRASIHAGADAATVVRMHRLAPLVEYAVLLQQAIDAERVIEAVVAERVGIAYDELLATLEEARRDATLGWARVAALEVVDA